MKKLIPFILLFILGIASCGGGGSNQPQGSSNWDEMTWDQDVWG